MQNYIHRMWDFSELFEKLDYKESKLGVPYTIMMFSITNKEKIIEFWEYLLKHLSKSDTIFLYSKSKIIVVLEETAIRWAVLIDEKLRKKIKKHWLKFKFYSSAIQWYSIEDIESLIKSLKKRLKKAKESGNFKLVHWL